MKMWTKSNLDKQCQVNLWQGRAPQDTESYFGQLPFTINDVEVAAAAILANRDSDIRRLFHSMAERLMAEKQRAQDKEMKRRDAILNQVMAGRSVLTRAGIGHITHRRRGRSPYGVGVCKTEAGHFKARISLNKRCYYLGTFKSARAAQLAYDKASERLFGDSPNGRTRPAELPSGRIYHCHSNHQVAQRRRRASCGVRKLPSGRFAAYVRVNKRLLHLGTFDTKAEARQCYASISKLLYDERK